MSIQIRAVLIAKGQSSGTLWKAVWTAQWLKPECKGFKKHGRRI